VQQIPGVQGVAVGSDLPATWSNSISFKIKGQPELPANRLPTAYDIVVTADYFQVAGIPLLRGRAFSLTDDASAAPIVVVNDKFVRRYFKNQDAIGKQIRLEVNGSPQEWREIVGVVGDVKTFSQSMQTDPQVYEPFLQRPVPSFSVMVRTSSDPNSMAPALRKAVAQEDAELPLFLVMSMSSMIELQTGGSTFFLEMLGTFALLALILSAIGIYGLLAYAVGQRRHEIAIRMALGASAREVRRMVLREGITMTLIGAAIGLLVALPLPRLFEGMLDGLRTGDTRTYIIMPAAILLVALMATYIPARRASTIDPVKSLHSE
jgi:putative ABC transport system permease protein